MSSKKDKSYRFIDLFAGIGGFHLGLEQTGLAHCVFASEWDEAARRTYEHNFKGSTPRLFILNEKKEHVFFARDIKDAVRNMKSIPDFDIVCGGFPCQPFSQAGHKRGFSDTRGTLFFDVEQIIRAKKPKAFFLENVRGLIKHGGKSERTAKIGKTLETILNHLYGPKSKGCLGYHPPKGTSGYFYIKASDFGVPQHRPRVFIIGFKDKSAADRFVLPKPQPLDEMALSKIMGGKVTFDAAGKKLRKIGFTLRCGGKGSHITDRRNWEHYYVKKKGQSKPVVVRINERQCLSLNGFPTSYNFPASVAHTSRLKQLGNSVAVTAINAWAHEIIAALG